MLRDKLKFLLVCLIVGFILHPNLALSNNEDLNTPFYEDDVFAIYPSSSYWCSPDFKYGDNVELDVVYNVSHEQRDKKLFRGSSYSDYSRFFNRKIVPIIAKRCPSFRGWRAYAKLHFNTKEDWSNNNRRDWDRMRFQYSRKAIRSRNGTAHSFVGMYKEQIITNRALAVLADKAAERREYAKQQGHPFRALAGGTYHDAIYTGDFVAQNNLAWYYLSQIKINNKDDIAMGMLLSLFGSTFSSTKKEMTVLEEISMYYLKRSTERPDDCFDSGALERTFTYNYPELVYGDGYRVPASKIKSKYRINPNFKALCDRLCEKQGVLYSVAHGMNAEMEKLEFADLFRGVDEMIQHYSCRSPEIKRFEKNLLDMNRREINQPSSVRRNTFQAMIDSPASRYRPYEPQSVIADQFMASNAKKPGVITTASGLQYIMLHRGHGQHPKQGEIVSIFYKETLANGHVTDKRYVSGTPRTSPIDNKTRNMFDGIRNHKGINEGIRLLKPGGRIKIFVPPELGFGVEADGTINKDSVVIYEIELVTSPNSPSHISEPPTITPQTKAIKEEKDGQQSVPLAANKNNLPKLNTLPKLDKPTTQNRPKPPSNKPVEKKPVENKPEKIIIQEKNQSFLHQKINFSSMNSNFPKKLL